MLFVINNNLGEFGEESMAKKIEKITALFDDTCQEVTDEAENWMDFLKTASQNYRLRFDEQVLIYAQRPDATAVLTLEDWNQRFNRWVKKNSKGIAVFDDEAGSMQRLKYYFDVKDTYDNPKAKSVTFWKMDARYEKDLMKSFNEIFGESEPVEDFKQYIMKMTEKIIAENSSIYMNALLKSTRQSHLEKMDTNEISKQFNHLLVSSVQFMILNRLGFDTNNYFDENTFKQISDFNTKYTLNALGFATSDIAKIELNAIAKEIVQQQKLEKVAINNKKENVEGEQADDERNHIHNGGGLSNAESGITRTDEDSERILREGLQSVSSKQTEGALLQSVNGLQTEQSLDEDRGRSNEDGRGIDGGNDDEEKHPRNEFSRDEEIEEDSSTDGIDGVNENLEVFDKRFLFPDIPEFDDREKIKEMLFEATTHKVKSSTMANIELNEVSDYFKDHHSISERADYLRQNMNYELSGLLMGEKTAKHFYKKYQNGMRFMKGSYLNPEAQSFYSWEDVVRGFEEIFDERNQNKGLEMNKKEEQDQSERLEIFDYKAIVQDHPCKNYIYQENLKRLIFAQAGIPFEFEGKTMQCLSEDLNSIKDFFEKNPEKDMRRVYLKNIFPTGENLFCVGDEQERYGFKKYEQGLFIWKGNFEDREGYSFEYWNDVVSYYEAIDMLGALSNDHWERAGVDETKENIITDEMIDIALQNGSGFEKGKMRIYEAMLRLDSQKEKADFLKHEYGIGGRSSAVPGFRINQNYDSKGFEFYSSYSDDIRVNLSWSEVSKRIDKLISEDRYLSEEEKEEYPIWLEAREETIKRNEEIMSAADYEDEIETDENEVIEYDYEVGDSVHLSGNKFEILEIKDDEVILYDFESPLFNQEMKIEEFEEKLRDDVKNNYLIHEVKESYSSLNDLISSAEKEIEMNQNGEKMSMSQEISR